MTVARDRRPVRLLRRGIGVLALAVSTSLVLAACFGGGGGGGGTGGGGFAADGCTHIAVATSSEKVNMLDALAAAFKDSPRARGAEDLRDRAAGERVLRQRRPLPHSGGDWPANDRDLWPTLWSPASTVWTDRVAAAASASLVGEPESFTRTPVVFGMPEPMAKALGWPDKPLSITDLANLCKDPAGWGSVGKDVWGSFKISKTNPNTSTTGLSTILMQSYEASGKSDALTSADVDAAADFSRVFEECVIHYGDTTGNVLSTLYEETQHGAGGSGYVSAVALEETSLINYNLGNPDSHTVQPGEKLTPPKDKLVAIYPAGGSMWSDNPITVLGADWVSAAQRTAGAAFMAFLKTPAAQKLLPEYGFRPLDATADLGELFTKSNGIDPAQPAITLPKPGVDTISAALDQWEQVRKPSSVLELIDISGSMDTSIGNGRSRLDGAIDGAQSTLSHFRSTDQVGVWAFTTGVSSPAGPDIVTVRDVGPLGTDRETLNGSLGDLRYAQRAGTPLYDAVLAAYKTMSARAEPGRINAIVLLSDGEDTDSTHLPGLARRAA